MARVLTAEWHRVAPDGRDAATRQWRERRERLTANGCHYWVFASTTEPGAFLEFIEAGDAATLGAARQQAGLAPGAHVLTELELS